MAINIGSFDSSLVEALDLGTFLGETLLSIVFTGLTLFLGHIKIVVGVGNLDLGFLAGELVLEHSSHPGDLQGLGSVEVILSGLHLLRKLVLFDLFVEPALLLILEVLHSRVEGWGKG